MPALITCIASFLILDGLWLGLIAKSLYRQELGSIMRMSNGAMAPNWLAALIVYVALIAGVMLFVIPKAQGQMVQALLWGALFGALTYAIYDFTNLAVLSAWNWKIAIIDTLWGATLCGLVSMATVWVSAKF
jgi:uncharacterized membrane protein